MHGDMYRTLNKMKGIGMEAKPWLEKGVRLIGNDHSRIQFSPFIYQDQLCLTAELDLPVDTAMYTFSKTV